MKLPVALHSAAQVRQTESALIAGGTPGYTLMSRAGAASYALLRQRWPGARRLAVVAGIGNNGGDGLVVARLGLQDGLAVDVMMLGDPEALRGEASEAFRALGAAGGTVKRFNAAALAEADLIVDALLGLGARAPLRVDWHAAIVAMNQSGRPVLALDLPSGLDPDSGHAMPAVQATATISFLALKQGLYLADGPDHVGELHFDALGPGTPALQPVLRVLTDECLRPALAPRPRHSHKSQFGRVLIIGGGSGMAGAVRLAGEAALRVGAGLVTVASLPEHLGVILGARPELMFHALPDATTLSAALAAADVIAIGPGLGNSDWSRNVLAAALAGRQPHQRLVVDADGLNLIAAGVGMQHCEDWLLTPHPGEAARLLGVGTPEVQQDRRAALSALCERRGGIVVLKGASTLAGRAGEVPWLCAGGNPGMAVPGMGDVLTGALAGLLAQGGKPFDCAAAAVHAHAVAGDRCSSQGIRGVLALDAARELRAVLAALP